MLAGLREMNQNTNANPGPECVEEMENKEKDQSD